MPTFIAPGVYTIERDFSNYVAGTQTTPCGLVGTARKGPLDKPVICTSAAQFASVFDLPTVNHYAVMAGANYLQHGNSLTFTRIARKYVEDAATIAADVAAAATTITVATGHGFTLISTGNYGFVRITQVGRRTTHNVQVTAVTATSLTLATGTLDAYTNGVARIARSGALDAAASAEVALLGRRAGAVSSVVLVSAIDPGQWGNFGTSAGLEVVVEDGGQFSNTDPTTGLPFQSTGGTTLQGVQPSQPSVDTKADLLALTGMVNGETRGVNYDSNIQRVSNFAVSGTTVTITLPSGHGLLAGDSILITGATSSNNNGAHTLTSVTPTTGVYTDASATAEAGPTGCYAEKTNGEHYAVTYRYNGTSWVAMGVHTKRVRVLYQGRQVELFDNIIGYDATSPYFWETVIGTVSNPVSKYITVTYNGSGEQPINSYNRTKNLNNPRYLLGQNTVVRLTDSSSASTTTLANASGRDGDNPSAADYIGTINGSTYTGLQHFRKVEQYEVSTLAVPGVTDASVIAELIAICDKRHDCLGIIDPPMALGPQEVTDWHNGAGQYTGDHSAFVSNCAALYWPWVKQFEPTLQRQIWMPPSVFVPGIIARSDALGEEWFAPAGLKRGKVDNAIAVEYQAVTGDVELFYGPGNGNAINPIMSFARDGIVVYGQRTLQRTPTATDRINVRRMLFSIEKNVANASRQLAFDQDDPVLWGQLRSLIEPYLLQLTGRRALESYVVICDESNNPPQSRNENEVNARVIVVPRKSAEKIILEFVVVPSGASVSEFIAANPA